MNKSHLYLFTKLILLLCLGTTASAFGDWPTNPGQWVIAEKTQAYERVMLAGGTTELKPMLKKEGEVKGKDSLSPGKTLPVKPERKMEKKKPVIPEKPKTGRYKSYFKIVGIQPPSGTSPTVIHGAKVGESLNQTNSVRIIYQYYCGYDRGCGISQSALIPDGGGGVPNYYGTKSSVKKGKGFTFNRFTIRCTSKDQPDTPVSIIYYTLSEYKPPFIPNIGGGIQVDEGFLDVNYIFTCKTSKERKKKASQIGGKTSP